MGCAHKYLVFMFFLPILNEICTECPQTELKYEPSRIWSKTSVTVMSQILFLVLTLAFLTKYN